MLTVLFSFAQFYYCLGQVFTHALDRHFLKRGLKSGVYVKISSDWLQHAVKVNMTLSRNKSICGADRWRGAGSEGGEVVGYVGYVAEDQDGAFGAGDGALLEPPAEGPEEDGGDSHGQEVGVADLAERERQNGGRTA